MPTRERRRHRRISVRLPATYRSANLTVDAFVANLSQGGLFIISPDIDSVGTDAEVVVNIPDESEPLVFAGSVVWSSRSAGGMGFHFRELSRGLRLVLANYLLQSTYTQTRTG